MSGVTVETVPLRHCEFEAKVKVGGSGPPLVYFHPAGGPIWDVFLDGLADHFTIYAPDHPGTGDTERDSIYRVETLWDLVLIYDELLDRLGLESVPVVGTSFGGMIACEVAAHRPNRIRKLVLLEPIGLWRDDVPVTQWMLVPQEDLPSTLFFNLEAEPVKEFLELPADPKALGLILADRVWALGSTGKFVWPIPDRGLKRRLHRISAETLIVWGEHDRLINPIYAQEFADRITDSRVEIIAQAGHVPQWEQLEQVMVHVLGFLGNSATRTGA